MPVHLSTRYSRGQPRGSIGQIQVSQQLEQRHESHDAGVKTVHDSNDISVAAVLRVDDTLSFHLILRAQSYCI